MINDGRKVLFALLFCTAQITHANADLLDYTDDELFDFKLAEDKRINMKIRFNGQVYESVEITSTGAVTFEHDQYRVDPVFPRYYYMNDPPLIAAFYLEISRDSKVPNLVDNPGKIYYRLRKRDEASSDDLAYMNETISIIRSYLAGGIGDLLIDQLLVVTWENVASSSSENANLRNTFQAVLLTATSQTFLILNYQKIQWTADRFRTAQAGLNLGYATRFIPFLSEDSNLESLSAFDGGPVQGRFVYSIGNTIIRGGCVSTSLDSSLTVWPREGPMLGGAEVEVSGPCLTSTSKLSCSFNGTTVDAVYINKVKASCISPLTWKRGHVIVELLVNDAVAAAGDYSITSVQGNRGLQLVNPAAWRNVNTSTLDVRWQPSSAASLSSVHDPELLDVELQLYAYVDGAESPLKHLVVLSPNILNTGSYSIRTEDYRCQSGSCDYDTGLLMLKVQDDQAQGRQLWSEPFSLGWHNLESYRSKHGANWAAKQCETWYNAEPDPKTWTQELPACPCLLTEALIDLGRWIPDLSCALQENPDSENCAYHKNAVHCVRSVGVTSSGAGNQCCYSQDGYLLSGADSYEGSTPDRAAGQGSPPTGREKSILSLSHFHHDVAPYLACCRWVGSENCFRYMARRPTIGCDQYEKSAGALSFGDPHISTFDGKLFNFNGLGDYQLLTSVPELTVHGRMEQVEDSLNASFVSALAARSPNTGPVVEVYGSLEASTNQHLQVFVNRKRVELADYRSPYVELQDIQLLDNDRIFRKRNTQSNVTVVFPTGVAIQVAVSLRRMLQVLVILPPNLFNKTNGLLGRWDGDASNDLPAGDNATRYRSMRSDYLITEEADSLLSTPQNGKTFQVISEDADSFTPDFDPEQTQNMRDECQQRASCIYDYAITKDQAIAHQTLYVQKRVEFTQGARMPASRCESLHAYYADKSQSNAVQEGDTVTVKCWSDYEQQGPELYTCLRSSANEQGLRWQPSFSTVCTAAASSKSNSAQLTGIIVGSVLAALLLIAVIIYVVWRKRAGKPIIPRRKSSQAPFPPPRESEMEANNSGFSEYTQVSPASRVPAEPRSRIPLIHQSPNGTQSDYAPPSYHTSDPDRRDSRTSYNSVSSGGSRGREVTI